MNKENCIVVGFSHGAVQLIAGLRQEGWQGDITVIGDEPRLPYHRPPLSKGVLSSGKTFEDILLRPVAFYQAQNVTVRLGASVSAIDRENHRIQLDNGEKIAYDKLVLATGASPIRLSLPGGELPGISYLRNFDDTTALLPLIAENTRAVVVGGGYIGLETAASLQQRGMRVTVLEAMPRILQRVTAPPMSDFYYRAHSRRGVTIVTNAKVSGFIGDGRVAAVRCEDGSEYPADLVIIGIGVRPNVSLAEQAGLAVENGIAVDECSRTDDPDIFAIGDCASFPCRHTGSRLRLESVPNATEQAKAAAAALCGKHQPYRAVPWFWSDQYDLKLQIAGVSQGFEDTVLRGDPEAEQFSLWYLRQNRLIAADCVNQPMDFMAARKLLEAGASPATEALADPSVDLGEYLLRQAF